jgi:ABC-2 type transport system permease protein
LNAYLSIFKLRLAVQLQYRAAAAAAFFTQFFFGMIIIMVYHAFYASSDVVQPMSLQQAVTYTWLGQAAYRMMPWNLDREITDFIRSGNVAYELCRPLDLYFLWYFRLLSQRIVPTLLSGLPLLLVTFFLPAGFNWVLPASAASGAAYLFSLLLALFLSCAISNLITVSAIWTLAGDGMQRLLPAVIIVFSGIDVPLAFFPDWAQTGLRLLPFSGLVDTPFRLYLGMIPPSSIFTFGLLQSFWIFVFICTGVLVLQSGKRKIVVQGG